MNWKFVVVWFFAGVGVDVAVHFVYDRWKLWRYYKKMGGFG